MVRFDFMSEKLNCWEWKQCGREPGGVNVASLGICPASTEMKMNGVHGGKNGGRTCWIVKLPHYVKENYKVILEKSMKSVGFAIFTIKSNKRKGGHFILSGTLLAKLRSSQ